tara:strand:+ start:11024 stop:12214 length:1191 start_codon:yes stop_codon:yes gene_type:complete
MLLLSPYPPIAAILIALLTVRFLPGRAQETSPQAGRFDALDGLRGYLAFSVYIHHSAFWYFYLHEGVWASFESRYMHFGHSAVAMFFMITGFLFFSKLLDARGRGIDWRRLYLSRVLRLTPLYLFAMAALFTIVAIESDFEIRESWQALILKSLTWLSFTVGGQPDLNHVADTRHVLAGVTWTLAYEWAFYLSLPIIALCIGVRPGMGWVLVGALGVALFVTELHDLLGYRAFLAGMVAAVLVRSDKISAVCRSRLGSVTAIALAATAICFFDSAYNRIALLLFSVVFLIVAGGNHLFGMLSLACARRLGDMGYSIYLLHGAVLYIVFRYVIGFESAGGFTPLQHWLVIQCVVPALIVLCDLTFRYIEKPGMNASPRVNGWLKMRDQQRSPLATKP